MLGEGVEATARAAARGGDVLVLPPAVHQPERGQTAQRSVDGDLRDPQTTGELQAVERRLAGPVQPVALGEDAGVELEHVPRPRLRHDPSRNSVELFAPRNR
jgi:hypothetical protein